MVVLYLIPLMGNCVLLLNTYSVGTVVPGGSAQSTGVPGGSAQKSYVILNTPLANRSELEVCILGNIVFSL